MWAKHGVDIPLVYGVFGDEPIDEPPNRYAPLRMVARLVPVCWADGCQGLVERALRGDKRGQQVVAKTLPHRDGMVGDVCGGLTGNRRSLLRWRRGIPVACPHASIRNVLGP